MMRTKEAARSGIPMTADDVRDYIARMESGTKSRAARIALAKAALRVGNVSPAGKAVYREYLESQ